MEKTVTIYRERDGFLDYIRGLIMLLVVYGHCTNCVWGMSNPLPWKTIAGPFTMPIYMGISGYLLYKSCRKHELKKMISGKVMRILVPCYIWELPLILLQGSANIWYLHASFICSLALILIDKLTRREKYRNVLILGSVCLFFLIPSDYFFLAWMYPFLVAGYYVGKVFDLKPQYIMKKRCVLIFGGGY